MIFFVNNKYRTIDKKITKIIKINHDGKIEIYKIDNFFINRIENIVII